MSDPGFVGHARRRAVRQRSVIVVGFDVARVGQSRGGGGGSPLDSLGGLAGAASPLAGLASGLGDQGNHERPSDGADKTDDGPDHAKDGKDGKADATTPPDGAQGAAGSRGSKPKTLVTRHRETPQPRHAAGDSIGDGQAARWIDGDGPQPAGRAGHSRLPRG